MKQSTSNKVRNGCHRSRGEKIPGNKTMEKGKVVKYQEDCQEGKDPEDTCDRRESCEHRGSRKKKGERC